MDGRSLDAGYMFRRFSPRKDRSKGALAARHLAAPLVIRVLAPIALLAAVAVIGVLCWRERREGQAMSLHIRKRRHPRLTAFE